jgi:5-methylcytosine-specific restriction endonuclease McrA
MKKKKKPKYNQNAAIRSAIRRAFSRSPVVQEVLQDARSERPRYKQDGALAKKPHVDYTCAVCGRKFKRTEVAADHIDPVIEIEEGFVDWNTFVERLGWERKDNLQVICNYKLKYKDKYGDIPSCHYTKTQQERAARKLAENNPDV